jgi:hypothetical protein
MANRKLSKNICLAEIRSVVHYIVIFFYGSHPDVSLGTDNNKNCVLWELLLLSDHNSQTYLNVIIYNIFFS